MSKNKFLGFIAVVFILFIATGAFFTVNYKEVVRFDDVKDEVQHLIVAVSDVIPTD